MKHQVFGAALLVITAGCAAPRSGPLPEPRALGSDIPAFGSSIPNTDAEKHVQPPEPKGALILRSAIALALTHSPELKAFSYDVRAAEARTLQAGLRPNPELEIELEEFDHDGEGMDSAEIVIGLGHTVELGGKRRWRKQVAAAEGELAGWDYEEARLSVLSETTRRFTLAIVAEQKLALAESAAVLAQKLKRTVDAHVAAGKEPQFQSARAAAELGLVQLRVLEARDTVAISRRKLANMWAADKATFQTLDGVIDRLAETLPQLNTVESYLAQNPQMARQAAALRWARAALAAEKAARIPDLEVSVALIQFEEDGTDALAFGVGTPLPLFDRNQGGIAAARYGLAKVETEINAARAALSLELAETHATLVTANTKARTLRDKVLPASETAFNAASEGYRQGKFAYVDVLDAQRSLFDVRLQMLDALADYHDALLSLEQLTGTPLNNMHKKSTE